MIRGSAATAFILLCTLLPFLPGRYDGVAIPLSVMALMLGRTGLLLVPIGALWLVNESTTWIGSSGATSARGYLFAFTGLAAFGLVCVFVTLGGFAVSGVALGVASLALSTYVVWRIARRLRVMRRTRARISRVTPLYLILVPVVVVLLQSALAGPVAEFTRNRAIRNSEKFLADIERYRAVHGRYPQSLLSLWTDYSPGVIGIQEYQYELNGDAYNVSFEQPSFQLGTREIVVYNRLDEQTATSHDMDLLQLTPAELNARRGYYAVHAASQPHWKYFCFD
jgi:hypothetical protein